MTDMTEDEKPTRTPICEVCGGCGVLGMQSAEGKSCFAPCPMCSKQKPTRTPSAPRKAKRKIALSITLSEEAIAVARELADLKCISISKAIEEAIVG